MILQKLIQSAQNRQKNLAVLIDPDKVDSRSISSLVEDAATAGVQYIFVGGSLLAANKVEQCVQLIKEICDVPVLLFPGSGFQITSKADAILFLSLVSGRNPDLLIGRQVEAAPLLREAGLEILSTAYMLIDGGRPTTVSYISNTLPIPADKPQIAIATAMAATMLGQQLIYMDAGSGALEPIPAEMIAEVKEHITQPLIIGGGINTASKAEIALLAGADTIVVGNVLEKTPSFLFELMDIVNRQNKLSPVIWAS